MSLDKTLTTKSRKYDRRPFKIVVTKQMTPSEWALAVINQLSNGKTVKEIAITKKVSARTLEQQLGALRKEYGCENITHLVATFLRNKVIE